MCTASHNSETPCRDLKKLAENENPSKILKNRRLDNVNRLIYVQLNSNFLRNKIDLQVYIVKNNIKLLMTSEKKMDSPFHN